MKNIGIDIGGTFIKCAVVSSGGNIESRLSSPTPKRGADIPEKVVAMIREVTKKAGIEMKEIGFAGIGAPGVCDSKRGVIVHCPNIQGCDNIPICEYVQNALNIKTGLDNDANCAALGEYMRIDEKPDPFVFVTLGTGVGGGIITDGRLLRGINYAGGEVGHIAVEKDGKQCNCGRRGCWEQYASVTALTELTKQAGFGGEVNGRTAFDAAAKGDEAARRVLDKWLEYVAVGICDLINIFQPDTVVIGGGVSREGEKITNSIEKYVRDNTMAGKIGLKQTKIRVSELFNDAGVVGASFLYTQK